MTTPRWARRRFEVLTAELTGTASHRFEDVAAALTSRPDDHTVWLAWSVIVGRLPVTRDVSSSRRMAALEGSDYLLRHLLDKALETGRARLRPVQIVKDRVIVDVHHTAETELATGIQRVARETIRRWDDHRDIFFVAWTKDLAAFRELTPAERLRARTGDDMGLRSSPTEGIIVPVGGWYLLPELAAEPWRSPRLTALVAYSGCRSGVIGFDTVPLTSAETSVSGMAAHFAGNLAAVANMDRVATISDAAATEYRGWRRMLSATGKAGPDIQTIMLPYSAEAPSDDAVVELRNLIGPTAGEPLVLIVGSHEPRKNHLSVLSAAETLWAEGHQFRLLFIGGNSWKGEEFSSEVRRLVARGRPIDTMSALSDRLLWAAYDLASFTVFPSFTEGFGLPVAESLATGTPVITSNYGSMKEIADVGGGALLINPYDDDDLARGMRRLLTEPETLARLAAQARQRPTRSWDVYETALWDYFTRP